MADFFDTDLAPHILGAEGGYVNHPSDRGGETIWGITVETARRYGYAGPMRSMPKASALAIYKQRYWIDPGFDKIADISQLLAAELFDTGVNMGQTIAAGFLQQALNAFNRQGLDYPDILADGDAGPSTRRTLQAYIAKRGARAIPVLLKALNVLQGARYFSILSRPANEDFMFGWIDNRVKL